MPRWLSPSPSPSCNCITVEGVYFLLSLPSTYACKCICICICDYDCICICICVTGNSRKHKSQICRMPHGDTQPTGAQGHRGGAKVDRRGVSGDFCRVPLVSRARPGARGVRRQVIGSGIHISRHGPSPFSHALACYACPSPRSPLPSGLVIGADSTNR